MSDSSTGPRPGSAFFRPAGSPAPRSAKPKPAKPVGWPGAETLRGLRLATVAAATAAADHVGAGDPLAVDGAAVHALRAELDTLALSGVVIAGEGEKDEAPMLAAGETFGTGGPAVEIAVDPVDGTRLAAAGEPGAMVVLGVAEPGSFANIGPAYYLSKIVAGARAPEVSLDAPFEQTLADIAAHRGVPVEELHVAIQDRPRNAELMRIAREAGVRCDFFEHGEVERSLRVLQPDADLDLVAGIGGAPEGLVVAAAVRALGGSMQARFAPQSRSERTRIEAAGINLDELLGLDRLCGGRAAILVSAVTECLIVPGAPLRAAEGRGQDARIWSWSGTEIPA
ncbi:fructose-1,6-bisphosphatase II [Mycetocola sp. BIGb0189]|uniref:fructose-bisphosphatase class II family protein n=1 Tax=Mycetocola sp. BIGb0189 TaxID=2940604 RepID=UPI002166E656|nr:fructose-bisphosphatase class II family protein [Mycetocola sp. BIGb0189]MCS4275465.1 fructose-1,6-bisphosphatase II [Mycetocola sp. BIGb0189]